MSDKKELEVISGDGSNLEVSPVYDHLNAANPKGSSQKPKNIVIPHVKSEKKDNDDDDENDEDAEQPDKKEQ